MMNDMGHLVHGLGVELEAPAWPPIGEAEAAHILSHFPDAGAFIGMQWHSPRPLSAAALVDCGAGTLFLKRYHHRHRCAISLQEEHDFIVHLQNHGVNIPPYLRTLAGDSLLQVGEWVYELARQGDGVDLYRDRMSWTRFINTDHAHAAGAALAALHQAAQDYDAPPRGPHILVSSFTICSAPDLMSGVEAYVDARPALAAYLADLPWRPQVKEIFDALGPGLCTDLAEQPRLWTHGDWHGSNLMWTPDGGAVHVASVVDFGLAAPTIALNDVAIALERSAIPWLSLSGGQIGEAPDVAGALALIAGYQTVRPISNADLRLMLRLLPLVHVEFALSEVDYFADILGDVTSADVAYHDYALGHARWFLTQAGQDFLADMGKGLGL